MLEVPELQKMLQEAQQNGFWGTIELTFQDGQFTMLRKVQTVKIQERNHVYDPRSRNIRS
jgi:hypothetical protein